MAVEVYGRKIWILKFLILTMVAGESSSNENLPSITYQVVRKNFTLNSTIDNSPVYYATISGAVLFFQCKALFPITWNFDGFINPLQSVKFHPPKRFLDDSESPLLTIFEIGFTFSFKDPEGSSEAGISMRISCETVESNKNSSQVFVFARDENQNPFVETMSTVTNSTLIPCPTMDPTPWALPKLFQRTKNGTELPVDGVSYRPTEGFVSTNMMFNGVYICQQGSYSKTVTAIVSGPGAKIVRAFSDEIIQLECFSMSNLPVNITVSSEFIGNIDVSNHLTKNRDNVQIRLKGQKMSSLAGSARCLESAGNGLSILVLKEWMFEFLSPPQLIFNDNGKAVSCMSHTDIPEMVQTIVCNDPIECNFMSRCFDNITYCSCKRHYSMIVVPCAEASIPENRCVSLPYEVLSQNGLVQCTLNGLVRKWEYFAGLQTAHHYTYWKNAVSEDGLMDLQQIEIDPKDKITRFLCVAAAYLFADSLTFEIFYKNGTSEYLRNNNRTITISDHVSVFGQLHRARIIDIEMPSEADLLSCHAPYWNMTMTKHFVLGLKSRGTTLAKINAIYIGLGLLLFLLVCAVFALLLYLSNKVYKKARELLRSLTDNEIEEFFDGRPESLTDVPEDQMEVVDFLPYNTDFEIPMDDLKFDCSSTNYLGSGEFSYVIRGKVISKAIPVAIKISKTSTDVTQFITLLSEVKIMIYIGKHDNVVALIGVCTEDIRNRSIYIVTEICELGSLDAFLRKARPFFISLMNGKQELDRSLLMLTGREEDSRDVITTLDLIKFSYQIANGMEYLSSKSVIHADLAARNVLLTVNKVVKISDFGLSKKLYQNKNYVKTSETPVPWRWMAIESLNTLSFSTASDVWGYGVTLFEVFTLGDVPFPNKEWNSNFYKKLELGVRLARPKHCTLEIYTKLLACWDNEPSGRPSFETLRIFFEEMISECINSATGNETLAIPATDVGDTHEQSTYVRWFP